MTRTTFSATWAAVRRPWPSWSRLYFLAVVVGVAVGTLAVLLYGGVHYFEDLLLHGPLGMNGECSGVFALSPWGVALLLGVPALGGLGVGLVTKHLCAEAGGSGTGDILRSYHGREARMDGRVVPYKWLTSCLSLGTGGAGGNEGPAAQIGAAFASWLSQSLGLGVAERGLLFTAGVAAGIGAIFRAPLGGALFACELYYSMPELEGSALLPSLIASVSAYFIFGMVWGYQALIPGETPFTLSVEGFAVLAGVAAFSALAARAFVRWIDVCSLRFKSTLALPWRPAMGGLLTGAVGLVALVVSRRFLASDARVLTVLGEGYPILGSAVTAGIGAGALLLGVVAVGKLLASGLTVGSGGSVGVFAPSMVIGGCLGAVAYLGASALGLGSLGAKACVLGGMAAFFSAGTACPLASLVIITEVAQGYHLLPGLMLAVAVGYLLRPKPGLFKDQLENGLQSPMHRAEVEGAFFASRRVGQVCRREGVVRLRPGAVPAAQWKALGDQLCAPLVDRNGAYRGALRLAPPEFRGSAPAKAVPQPSVKALHADQLLGEGLHALRQSGCDELPVLDAQGALVGLFGYRDLVP